MLINAFVKKRLNIGINNTFFFFSIIIYPISKVADMGFTKTLKYISGIAVSLGGGASVGVAYSRRT
jgi:hypothetical protein